MTTEQRSIAEPSGVCMGHGNITLFDSGDYIVTSYEHIPLDSGRYRYLAV